MSNIQRAAWVCISGAQGCAAVLAVGWWWAGPALMVVNLAYRLLFELERGR